MNLTLVSEQLLAANKLSHQDLFNVLGQMSERRLDYADLYFQSSYHESWLSKMALLKMALTTSIRALACERLAVRKQDLPMQTKLR
ncbi:protease TldD [Budvicia aquatica]|uniref:Protease TldD n=1 Tax=Budvicia aquatica TaxID=82979 RepID=A0A484ZAR6_9GAMM|nr:protease TldD [Budvicia aquatica]